MGNPETTRDMLGRQKLTSVPSAREQLLEQLEHIKIETESVILPDAFNRVSANNVYSPEDLPPCDRSTMDGYAVIAADTFGASQTLPAYLDVTGEVFMGQQPNGTITRGNCYKIPTGGMLPDGADAVQMFEHTVAIDEHMIELVKDVGSGSNIIRQGDDIRKGACAVSAGTLLRPQDIGLLAGLGIECVEVFRKLRVAIVSTGDEIVSYSQPLPIGKIRNINSITLRGSVERLGAEVIDYGIVPDTEDHFFPVIEQAVAETNLVLFSGGSSVGMKDLGEQAISRLGQPGILVHGVALKPGKPVIIGLCQNTPVFGLPGHPVSALVCFNLFVEPAIKKLSGQKIGLNPIEPSITATLRRSINSAAGRLDIVRVRLSRENDKILAFPVLGRSGAISTLSNAHGYFLIDEETQGLPEGSPVEVFIYQ